MFPTIYMLEVGADRMLRQGVRSYMQQSRVFVGMVLILIFGEVLGLYGWARPTLTNLLCMLMTLL